MSKKKQHHEEHVDETWLIPYADMLTLLLALFIVMFAMSKLDNQKVSQVSQQLNAIFAGGSGIIQSSSGADSSSIANAIVEAAQEAAAKAAAGNAEEENKMHELKAKLDQEIAREGYSDKVITELNKDGLYISIQDVILFNSGDANVLKEVSPLLTEISHLIRDIDNRIRIVGHTDNVPISTVKFRSNWDLSAMRAINVMNFMVDTGKLNPEKVSIQAYGEYMPRFDNSTAENRARNRRVEIFIIR
ncbi:flagellar motor protein MotB [Clostridium cellulovorans]|uniref:OmpA/MotB domain protein n=1 Tax=Clostridium cellulovorans (strain ATCC 35296 / DSM 3052 / OCM 3 / 743B) TaxID=573061 RepID=D9STN4_CLOC7|nr:flagellar motor protein MotB [Clostridium cellulovorans]ADL52768.1 OmpA/MotB domain protein [Clostridium cellulovorans 743B]